MSCKHPLFTWLNPATLCLGKLWDIFKQDTLYITTIYKLNSWPYSRPVAQLAEHRTRFARLQVWFPAGRPEICIFRNRSRLGVKNVLTVEIFLCHKVIYVCLALDKLGWTNWPLGGTSGACRSVSTTVSCVLYFDYNFELWLCILISQERCSSSTKSPESYGSWGWSGTRSES